MAGPRTYRSPCRNLLLASKDELAKAAPRALTNDSGIPSYTFTVSHIPTPAPAPFFAPTELMTKYTNANLQKTTKLAPELFIQDQQQAQRQMAPPALELWERPLKAWFPDLYYGNSHLDCYWFCQQCKDYFEIAEAKKPNRILFAALFLRRLVTQQ